MAQQAPSTPGGVTPSTPEYPQVLGVTYHPQSATRGAKHHLPATLRYTPARLTCVYQRHAKARRPSRVHGIIHVCPQHAAHHNVQRVANSHHIAGLAGRQPCRALRHHAPEHVFGLSARQATNGIPRGVPCHQLRHAHLPQLDIKATL